jgi:hypothetical protein
MLKMKIDPAMCMETQARMTKCPAKNRLFYTKTHQLRHNRQESPGLLGRKCTNCAINRGEVPPSFRAYLITADGSAHAELKFSATIMAAVGNDAVENNKLRFSSNYVADNKGT